MAKDKSNKVAKPSWAKDDYLKDMVKKASRTSFSHPDVFTPKANTRYRFVFLPGRKERAPYRLDLRRYYGPDGSRYMVPDGDPRKAPLSCVDLIEEGKDPLFNRYRRFMQSKDESEREIAWKLQPHDMFVANVMIISLQEQGKEKLKGKGLGELHGKALLLVTSFKEYSTKIQPLWTKDSDDGDDVDLDVFGEFSDEVPVFTLNAGPKREIYGPEKTISFSGDFFDISAFRGAAINLWKHEVTTPHTVEELDKCLTMTVGKKSKDTADDDYDYEGDDDGTTPGRSGVKYKEEDVDDDDDEDEKPKKSGKKTSSKKPAKDEEDEDDSDEDEDEKPAKKKTGAKKPSTKKPASKKSSKSDDDEDDEDEDDDEDDTPKQRKPAGKKTSSKKSSKDEDDDDEDTDDDEDEDDD